MPTVITRERAEFLANGTTFHDQSRPSVTRLASGGFVVVWQDMSKTGADTDVSAIRAQVFDAAGNIECDANGDRAGNPLPSVVPDNGHIVAAGFMFQDTLTRPSDAAADAPLTSFISV